MQARIDEARRTAIQASGRVAHPDWRIMMRELSLGYMDPVETFARLSPDEQRAVLCLAYYGGLQMP